MNEAPRGERQEKCLRSTTISTHDARVLVQGDPNKQTWDSNSQRICSITTGPIKRPKSIPPISI